VGYVRYNVPIGDPRFGKLYMCPNAQRRALEISLKLGDIDPRVGLSPDEIRGMTWDLIQDGINDAPKALQAVKAAYSAGYGMVFLYGVSGQAKTLLLKIAVAVAFREGRTAAYADMRAVLDDIRLAYDEKENKQRALADRMAWWLSRQVLAIDELDKVNSTDWAAERIFYLVDQRYQRAARGDALTLIAANYNRLDEISSYLRSRINDNRFAARGWVVRLDGPDGRQLVPLDWPY
jgi:DNA replication protein DnaC